MLANFAFLTAFLSIIYSLFTPILFLFYTIGIKYYIVRKDNEKTRAIIKAIQKTAFSSTTTFQCGSFYPSGYFVNWQCVGYFDYIDAYEGVSAEIHILTTPAYFEKLSLVEQVIISFTQFGVEDAKSASETLMKDKDPTQLVIYSRAGTYTGIYYSRIRTDIHDLSAKGQQQEIVDDIYQTFIKKRRGVFFIHGASGVGKSTVGFLVAKRLNGVFCHTFNPTDPGDTLHHLLRDLEPLEERPTIILLEEANTMIRALHENQIQKHKNVTTCIHNKSTYNTFMDDLILYRNVLIIMTSNESKEKMDELDPCYLRKGRVNEYYSMMSVLDT